MVTLSTYLKKPNKTGNTPVYIRVYVHGKSKFIRLPFNLMPNDITPKGKIRNRAIEQAINKELLRMNAVIANEGVRINAFDIDRIVGLLTHEAGNDVFRLDFFEYARKRIEALRKDGRGGTADATTTATNSFAGFYGSDKLDINDMSRQLMQNYIDHLYKTVKIRSNTIKAYIAALSSTFSSAVVEYNCEDIGKVLITRKPFENLALPVMEEVQKRNVGVDVIRMIYELDLSKECKTMVFGRDLFILSYCLCGMNAADMYTIDTIKDGVVDYRRSKTKLRSGERSRIVLTIPDEAKAISDKYLSEDGCSWKFSKMYSNKRSFDHTIGDGIKMLRDHVVKKYAAENGMTEDEAGAAIHADRIQFYAARHTWSSVASNNCGISSDIIDRCLCHSSRNLADKAYIDTDYSYADKANRKVLDATFCA